MIAWLTSWLACRHRAVLYDRVNGVPVWRCADCMAVKER